MAQQSPFSFYNPDDEEERLLREAQLSPEQQDTLRAKRFERMTERGLLDVGSKVLGVQVPEQQRAAANAELQALAQRMRPGTEEFYKAASDILRKHGLVAEADMMMEKARALTQGKGAEPLVMQLQRTRDSLLKRKESGDNSVDAALAAIERQMKQLGVPRESSAAQDKDYEYYRKKRDEARAAKNEKLALEYQKVLDALLRKAQGEKTDSPSAAAREARLKKKDEDKSAADKQAAIRALRSVATTVGRDWAAASRLLQHPGLQAIVGPEMVHVSAQRARALVQPSAAGALALFLNVQGRTFLTALQDLKSTSKVGASGLGQLTEREGDKIQNARVALDAQQPYEQFRVSLTEYIGQLKSAYDAAASELGEVGEAAPPLPAIAEDRPAKIRKGPEAVVPDAPARPKPILPAPTAKAEPGRAFPVEPKFRRIR